ncbi:MAG: UDP-N-acetylglucosamine--N-acetylmuramyl-(pentapeptide) pyrophosphoryl-undecaprenol N-acetylglucosamine transferase [Candidatus Dojkabacteria bacterium]
MNSKKILITGGGSGGHLFSANTLIECLIHEYRFPKENITYVGGDLGMEGDAYGNSIEQREMVGKDFKVLFIRAGKLQRRFSLRSVKPLLRVVLGFLDANRILRKEKPSIVISTGGFVSVPICIVAWLRNIPIFLHEQTTAVGLSNKIVSKVAKKIYIAFKDSERYFNKRKTVHVGNIIRREILRKEPTPNTNREVLSLVENRKKPLLYISGGSLGSHKINKKVLSDLDSLLERYTVLLQTGKQKQSEDYNLAKEIHKNLEENKRNSFLPIEYIDRDTIGYVLNNMDMFLGRSGANTVYEIGVLKKNALFIPIPWVTHNEQYLNAKVLENIGTAKILEEKYLDEVNLSYELERFEEQLALREISYKKLEELFPTNASSTIVQDILNSF